RDLGTKEKDVVKAAYYQREVQFGEQQLKELKTEPQCYHTMSGYDLVLHNWSDLKGWSITFRFLSDIVQLDASWRTDPEVRLGLLDLMKSVSKEWE
ncbi:MAG TPA: hypothetical protein DGZ34_11185, partial [Lachnospiraceae bacterium]|nr:hypothetical protein [Lachnospiraceae bacterium]